MHDDRQLIEERLQRALRERIRPAIYGAAVPLDIKVWHAPGEPVSPAEALAASYEPAEIGLPWGPAWGTAWFHFSGQVPAEWAGNEIEAVIDLGFSGGPGFSAEGLVHTTKGVPLKGLHPRQTYAPLSILGPDGTAASAGDSIEFYVEAAANPEVLGWNAFAPVSSELGSKPKPGGKPIYELTRADLAVFNAEVWNLILDLEALDGLQKELLPQEPRSREILRALSRALDVLDYENVAGTAADARAELTEVLSRPAHASAHQISAVGHAHIDSAWLWPLRETKRKVARTVSNVATLAEEYPELIFAFSQAQQHAWVKDNYPDVWERLKKAVAEGTIVPVGGMWVESDTNLPGGEALARQFVHGKRFFLDEYGIDTQEVWLPDSFGYTAALPQLVKLSGSKWFLTQKISWNQKNKFPHHTFWWEGLDGTQVFTHFPPIDTYNSNLSGHELAKAQRNFAENGSATRSLAPFGYGDGGGGPTREFIATARRVANLESSPRVTIESPTDFFSAAQEEYPNAPVWSGELYLEIHRATYTSQAKTKQGNRRSEHLLREAELWSAAAVVAGKLDSYPYDELDRIWKAVLLNQFHDILPGSSIAWVHREAEATYARLAEELEAIIAKAQQALAGSGDAQIVFNAAPHIRGGVAGLGAGIIVGEGAAATIEGGVLDNGVIRVTIDERGLITSLYDLEAGREVIAAGSTANLLQLHVDTPNQWDAWDVDSFYKNNVRDITEVDSVDFSTVDGVATVVVKRSFNRSSVTQTLRLRSGAKRVDIETAMDWHESEKFLKAAFPVDVHADRSASETQFGHIFRPTHQNTSWDAAKFEIAAHRWVHVGEPGYGVAVVNDSTYGHDINRTAREDGGTTTTIRTSLIRAPRFPDPDTDQGLHVVNHALVVGAGIPEAIEEGYRINLPERVVTGAEGVDPIVALDNNNVIVEAVKLADDQSGDVVVRLYESSGGRGRAKLTTGFAAASVTEVDLLERHLADHELKDGGVAFELRPFQILTLRFKRS
ncbi:MAG: alpha-mannosidase [Kribbellaceae bacterium]|nr:alpha-mannosidase [Kribbellaceae bacterium]